MIQRKKNLPIGMESFEEIRTNNFYYVDKTGLIIDLLNSWCKVTLFTRPRRFGKSLNMSMLEAFFSPEADKSIFDGLKVAEEKALCEEYMGKYPVISISLKGGKCRQVIILIDEYDVPLAKAHEQGYYDEMIILIRNLFENALKTNRSLKLAVLTGCMRISKESIFTGLNNLRVLSAADERADKYFGFTDPEVRDLLVYYGLSDKYEEVREWYDGFWFGRVNVYCPWDDVFLFPSSSQVVAPSIV